jgi:transposase
VGQQGTLTHVWAARGSRPPAVRDDRHDSAWLFGAVCPERAVGAAVVMPWVSSEAMSEHLAVIGKAVQPSAHAVLVCDGAGWHQSGGRLLVPDNISPLRLPSYAPELNPIENVWEYIRANYLSISVWNTYEQIVDACCRAWNAFVSDAERVISITTRRWARVTN